MKSQNLIYSTIFKTLVKQLTIRNKHLKIKNNQKKLLSVPPLFFQNKAFSF